MQKSHMYKVIIHLSIIKDIKKRVLLRANSLYQFTWITLKKHALCIVTLYQL